MSRKQFSSEGPAAQSPAGFNRRHFLRGLGACVALPAFVSLLPTRLMASSAAGKLAVTSTGAPLRSAFLYFPNGAIPGDWWPKDQGTDFALSKTLQPLAEYRKNLQIIGGLDDRCAQPNED